MLCLAAQVCLTLCNLMDSSPPGSSVLGDSPGKNTGCHGFLQGNLPNPGIEPRFSALQVDSLPSEPPGKPKNSAVGSLTLLQWICPTQESNQGLLHCRWILYQLSYQGSSMTVPRRCQKTREWVVAQLLEISTPSPKQLE